MTAPTPPGPYAQQFPNPDDPQQQPAQRVMPAPARTPANGPLIALWVISGFLSGIGLLGISQDGGLAGQLYGLGILAMGVTGLMLGLLFFALRTDRRRG